MSTLVKLAIWLTVGIVVSPIFVVVFVPILRILKYIGAEIGSIVAPTLASLYFTLPLWVRFSALLLVMIAVLRFLVMSDLPTAFRIFLIIWVCFAALWSFRLETRFRSPETKIIFGTIRITTLVILFEVAQICTNHWFLRLFLVSMLYAAPEYCYRSIQRVYALKEVWDTQQRRDKRAEQILQSLQSGQLTQKFCLYLRPFFITNRLAHEIPESANSLIEREGGSNPLIPLFEPHWSPSIVELIKEHVKDDLEDILAHSVSPFAQLVAIGKPREALGAGRTICQNVDWQEKIALMMKYAHFILVVPSSRPGTLWEIKYIVRMGYIEKTIFIMPSVLAYGMTNLDNAGFGSYYEEWTSAQASLLSEIELPPYDPQGAIFKYLPSGNRVTFPAAWEELWAIPKTRQSLRMLLQEGSDLAKLLSGAI